MDDFIAFNRQEDAGWTPFFPTPEGEAVPQPNKNPSTSSKPKNRPSRLGLGATKRGDKSSPYIPAELLQWKKRLVSNKQENQIQSKLMKEESSDEEDSRFAVLSKQIQSKKKVDTIYKSDESKTGEKPPNRVKRVKEQKGMEENGTGRTIDETIIDKNEDLDGELMPCETMATNVVTEGTKKRRVKIWYQFSETVNEDGSVSQIRRKRTKMRSKQKNKRNRKSQHPMGTEFNYSTS